MDGAAPVEIMTAPCPSCGGMREADGKSCSCGWRVGKAKSDAHQINMFCPVCGERGSMSDGLRGQGPWYCSEHWWQLKDRERAA